MPVDQTAQTPAYGQTTQNLFIGCAGWSIPGGAKGRFALTGSHLERYSGSLAAVEINSSFYRPHRRQTYEKWAAAVPEHFRFAVKVPKAITHEMRLRDAGAALAPFLSEVAGLGGHLGPLLIQLPPSLQYDGAVTSEFLDMLRSVFAGQVACEPRHPSWFTPEAGELLTRYQVTQVAADPAVVPAAAEPGGWQGLCYYRLHGSPVMYRSPYSTDFLQNLATKSNASATRGVPTWCIFDNTAEGAAMDNALAVQLLEQDLRLA